MKVNALSCQYDTSILNFEPKSYQSPLSEAATGGKTSVNLAVDAELIDEFIEPQTMQFELAGPRRELFFDPARTRCAVVTCGGLCPGINDVIRSLVMTAFHAYNVPSFIGFRYGLRGLTENSQYDPMPLTPASVGTLHELGGTILGTSRGAQSPQTMVDTLERFQINILFIIGGDGTMKAASAIQQEIACRNSMISVIGIPKTIDNDIHFVPHSFGFETAVEKAADAIRCAYTEASSVLGGIGIVKLMGRESGFIAASAALSFREVAFVLIPESPFSLHGERGLLAALERRLEEYGHAVIVVAEGAGQQLIQVPDATDASGNRDLGDIAAMLRKTIASHFSNKKISYYLKYIDPSYTIRSVPANANDRIYCGFLGQHAVHAAMSGKTGMVVAKVMDRFVHLPLALITRRRRTLNPCSALWKAVLESTGQDIAMGILPEPVTNSRESYERSKTA